MSIAEQEKQINQVINSSKQRLRIVDEKLEMLGNEKVSIDQDIGILTQRLQIIKDRLANKRRALDNVTSLAAEADDAYKKLRESSKLLLVSLKKQCKKVDALIGKQEPQEDIQ